MPVKYGSLDSELLGAGFGGALLHLLRLGSISPLYVVQVSGYRARLCSR